MLSLALLIVLLIFYVYQLHFSYPSISEHFGEHLADVWSKLKTGDLIIFHATDNHYSLAFGCYYSHIGVVVMVDDVPFIFEAAGVRNMTIGKIDPTHRGILFTDLAERITRYKGYCFVKRINKAIVDARILRAFYEFIQFALDVMYYEYAVFRATFMRFMGAPCGVATNCAELAFLSLIKLGILNQDEYECAQTHLLYRLTHLGKCNYGYAYSSPLYLPVCEADAWRGCVEEDCAVIEQALDHVR